MTMAQEHIKRLCLYCLCVVMVTLFYFPMMPRGFSMNSKTILAGLGLVVALFEVSKSKTGIIRKDLLVLSVFAIAVSFCSLLAVTINNTSDYTYVTYIITMWIWISAAYTAIWFIRRCFGYVDISLLTDLIIWASLIQCFSAIAIDQSVWVHDFVDRLFDHRWTESVNRLYGISTELDTAGIHFSVILVLISYLLGNRATQLSTWKISFYWLSFIAITVIGNIIARTTLAGTALGLLLLLWKFGIFRLHVNQELTHIMKVAGVILILCIPVIIYFYNHNARFYENMRFGFEGFFSLVEKGKWDVASNNTLKRMVVWPDTLHTWLVGDGYIVNPKSDPYYIGEITEGYYKNTDIGYLRFIYYFGLPGLIAFSAFIIRAAITCAHRLQQHNVMIFVLVVLNFVIWLKVSTDIFFIFAMLYCIDAVKEDEKDISLSRDDLIVKI